MTKDQNNASQSSSQRSPKVNVNQQQQRKPEEEGDQDFGKGAFAGPSSPTRRRRPSASRRRSSTVRMAANTQEGDDNENDVQDAFGGDAADTVHDAKVALGRGKASPYHMAIVTLLFSLAQGMPLASQFKVYSYMMCQVYQRRVKSSIFALPPPPELPSDPICEDIWVENATSTYAAAMATVGALLGLILLNRCSRLSSYFGRKPLLLLTHFLLAISTLIFRLSVLLPTYVGVVVLYITVMILEASAGAPLKIAIQEYVVDTTTETQRAGALSFTDGFGQIGAFPSSTLGGWLAVVTQQFFAPFYATIAVYVFAMAYVLVFVPESKKRHHHTLIDDFERGGQDDQSAPIQSPGGTDGDTEGGTEGGFGTASYFSSDDEDGEDTALWLRVFHRFNFLAPLSAFFPRRVQGPSSSSRRNWHLFVLAIIVLLEESFQVFMVPMMILYNTRVFGYDVVQNGYLVSLLQGIRALYLTIFFPWMVSRARAWWQARKTARQTGEQTPLLTKHTDAREERGKLDIVVMLLSYIVCMASFLLLATTRKWSEKYNEQDGAGLPPPWLGIAFGIVGLQLGAGATSLRTAILVNAVSDQEDQREENEYQELIRKAQQDQRQYLSRSQSALVASRRQSSQLSFRSERSARRQNSLPPFHIHHDRHQSKALAANQILCTAVYALLPLATSKIFGLGLQFDRPELVWYFKAVMAAVSALATLALLFTYDASATITQTANETREGEAR